MTLGRKQEMEMEQTSALQGKQALLDCWLTEGKGGITYLFISGNTGDNDGQSHVSETGGKESVQERSWRRIIAQNDH